MDRSAVNSNTTKKPKNNNNTDSNIKKMLKKAKSFSHKVNVDIVTGNEVVSVYFDPDNSLDCKLTDSDWIGLNYFVPASVIKEEDGIISVRLNSGEVFKMTSATRVTDMDDEGVDDILKLRDFSEKSLIHTLRVRYDRDEIYTFVGPILISINPYKRMKHLYSEETMTKYHEKKEVLHLFSLFVLFFSLIFDPFFLFLINLD
jgi:hypothetical protein